MSAAYTPGFGDRSTWSRHVCDQWNALFEFDPDDDAPADDDADPLDDIDPGALVGEEDA